MNIKTFNGVDTKTPHGKIMIGVVFQFAAGSCCATPTNTIFNGKTENGESAVFFSKFRVQTCANVVHATVSENRTPRRTHIFLSFVVSRTPGHV